MKRLSFLLALAFVLIATSCNSNKGDNNLYYAAELLDHVTDNTMDESEENAQRYYVADYEITINASNNTAEVSGTIKINDNKTGTIDVAGLTATYEASTNTYVLRQGATSVSQGTYAVTDFAGRLDVNQSSYNLTQMDYTVESHYEVHATLGDINFSKATSKVNDATTIKNGNYLFTFQPTAGTATLKISNTDFDGNLTGKTLVYEGLKFKAQLGGYLIYGENIAPTLGGDATLKKYTLNSLSANVNFYDNFDAVLNIENIGKVSASGSN